MSHVFVTALLLYGCIMETTRRRLVIYWFFGIDHLLFMLLVICLFNLRVKGQDEITGLLSCPLLSMAVFRVLSCYYQHYLSLHVLF